MSTYHADRPKQERELGKMEAKKEPDKIKSGQEQQLKAPAGGGIRLDRDGIKVAVAVGHTVLFPNSPCVEAARQEVADRLQRQPERIAALLEQGTAALLPLLPEEAPWLAVKEAAEDISQDKSSHALGLHADTGKAGSQVQGAAEAIGTGSMPVAAEYKAAMEPALAADSGSKAVPSALRPGRCSCGDPGCDWVAPAQAAVATAWASGAAERLRLLGWTREALLAAVWAAWAAAAPLADAEAALRRAAGPRESERRPAAGPHGQALAERLAEAAEQGRLHEPAPEFHDVDVELRPAGPAAAGVPQGPDPAPWAAMLPGVRGAATGLSQVAGRVMQRAEELAAPLRTKPQ